MSKSIDNLKLSSLLELKQAVDLIVDTYGNDLTTYAQMYGDTDFSKMSNDVKRKYSERMKAKALSEKIRNRIETMVSEYYD